MLKYYPKVSSSPTTRILPPPKGIVLAFGKPLPLKKRVGRPLKAAISKEIVALGPDEDLMTLTLPTNNLSTNEADDNLKDNALTSQSQTTSGRKVYVVLSAEQKLLVRSQCHIWSLTGQHLGWRTGVDLKMI